VEEGLNEVMRCETEDQGNASLIVCVENVTDGTQVCESAGGFQPDRSAPG
jgi:hypothetical protein